MKAMPWPELREKLLALPKGTDPVEVRRGDVIVDEELFVNSHIRVIDQFPKKPNLTNAEKNARLNIAKPHYDRLHAYYLLKTQL